MAKEPEAQSKLHLEAELGRDAFNLAKLDLHTGEASELHATGELKNFAKPDWQVKAKGSLELKQLAVLTDVDGLKAGTVDLDVKGHNCRVTSGRGAEASGVLGAAASGEGQAGIEGSAARSGVRGRLSVVGTAKIRKAAYRDQYVRLHDVDGSADLHVTPSELLLTALVGYLPGGGSATGELRIANWLGEVPPEATQTSPTTQAAAATANNTAKSVGAKPPVGSTARCRRFSRRMRI